VPKANNNTASRRAASADSLVTTPFIDRFHRIYELFSNRFWTVFAPFPIRF